MITNKIQPKDVIKIHNDLRLLGLKNSLIGTVLLNKAIQVVIINNDECFNLKDIYKTIANSSNGKFTTSKVRESIRYAIDNRNNIKTKQNFKSVFGYDYETELFCNKNFILELFRVFLNNYEQ